MTLLFKAIDKPRLKPLKKQAKLNIKTPPKTIKKDINTRQKITKKYKIKTDKKINKNSLNNH